MSRHALSLLAASLLLAACGGGGSDNKVLSGQVIDGPIAGAEVFLDLNDNLERDPGEPVSAPSDASGRFQLAVPPLSTAQLTLARLVTHVPVTARDADDNGLTLQAAGRAPFSLSSPLSAFVDGNGTPSEAVITPLTTLVAHAMNTQGLSLSQAREQVQDQLGLINADPLSNFTSRPDLQMATLARSIANQLGDLGGSLPASLGSDDVSVREHIDAAVNALISQLPARLPGLVPPARDTAGVQAVDDGEASPTTPLPKTVRVVHARSDFVVVLKPGRGNPQTDGQQIASTHGGQILQTYTHALRGFAVSIPSPAVPAFLAAMSRNPNVDTVTADAPVKATLTTQTSATWGLDRSDQRDLPLTGSYDYETSGNGVRAYVVDTGILASHVDFGGRVGSGYTAIADGNGTSDCNGHGTHVAGTVGGSRWGIAKGVTLVPVRVLDCSGSGSMSGVLAGLDWIVRNGVKPAVVNMSLGGPAYSTLDTAVANTVNAGFTVVVAAGNDNLDACTSSPARAPSAITVGASTSSDARASFSNFGSCLDLFAPGNGITSAWYSSTTAIATASGTSMASPHVAGAVALLLESDPASSPVTLTSRLLAAATTNHVSAAGIGSPNLLLYTLPDSIGIVTPAPTTTPVSVSNLTGSRTRQNIGWRATVTVSVKNGAGAAVANATVNGSFTAGGSAVSCVTGSTGSCSVSTGRLSNLVSQTTYSVKGISGSGMTYDASANVSSSITLQRP